MHIGCWWESQKERDLRPRRRWEDNIKMYLRKIEWVVYEPDSGKLL
jgi:hypothetical protein